MLSKHTDLQLTAAIDRFLSVSADEVTHARLKELLSRPGTRFVVAKGDEAIFQMETYMREDLPAYQFFVMGKLVEIRRLTTFSDKYSFVDFPQELEEHRQAVQEKFSTLFLTTEEGLGWFAPGPWAQLGESAQALCWPKFVEDNIRHIEPM